MSKAKLSSDQKHQPIKVEDYDNYIRYGYRMPNGLLVTRRDKEIPSKDLERLNLSCSVVDMMPVYETRASTSITWP